MPHIEIGDTTVLFDEQDRALVSAWRWHIHKTPKVLYARGYEIGHRKGGLTYLHRLILGAAVGDEVDHINGIGTDNRRSNLRFCTRSQNIANRHNIIAASGVTGVYYESATGKWRAEIRCSGQRYRLGRFINKSDAAAAYAKRAVELFGEFANPGHATRPQVEVYTSSGSSQVEAT